MLFNSISIIITVFIGILAAAVVGVLTGWLLKRLLPEKPKLPHIIAGIIAIMIFTICAACPTFFNLLSSTTQTGTVTRSQVEEWSIGSTDRATVYDIIYNQIHIVPGKRQFITNATIPAEVLITTDLGDNWSQYPVRTVARNGGWGVFETTASFKSPTTGEYWLITP